MATRIIIEVSDGCVTNVYTDQTDATYIIVEHDSDTGTDIGREMQQDDIASMGDGTIEGALEYFRKEEAAVKATTNDTYEDFIKKYQPEKNTIDDNAGMDGYLYEIKGKEAQYVSNQQEQYVWTVIDEDGTLFLENGLWYANRFGYIITKEPWEGEKGDIVIDLATEPDEDETPTHTGAAIHDLYPRFKNMDKQFSRLSRDEFTAYCHSMMSGIAMAIRNEYSFWPMFNGDIEKSRLYKELERNLVEKGHMVHPDAMSNMLTGLIYDKYHAEHPEAYKERQAFQAYMQSPEYKPIMPFDLRMPSDKQ
jgi:hypothetical protein